MPAAMPPDVARPPRGMARLLFGLYCLLYGAFIGANLVAPMAAGTAVASGLGLIVLAVVFALIYAGWGGE